MVDYTQKSLRGKQQTRTRITENEQPTIEEVAQTYKRGGKKWKELTEYICVHFYQRTCSNLFIN